MREVLFRGKCADGCGWVYGYLNQDRNGGLEDCYGNIIGDSEFYINSWSEKIDSGSYGVIYKIIPGTAGQYIGQKDKNACEIFEGDILRGVNGLYLIRRLTECPRYPENLSGCEIIGNIFDDPCMLLEGGGK